MAKNVDITFRMRCAIREDRQTSSFVSYCPALDLFSAGRTRPEARSALAAAVQTYLRLCFDRGILGRVLKTQGFMAEQEPAAPQASVEYIRVAERTSDFDDEFDVDVPMHLVAAAQQQEGSECLR